MRYTEYGKTGKQVSVVGFGGMRFDRERSDEENAELVRYACSRGINFFDTAPGYGKSEDIFGIAFKEMPGEYFVSTKARPSSCETAEKTRQVVMKSLDRMHVAKIDFFHVWCLQKMEHYEAAMRPGGMYEGLLQCKQEGLIDHIVCSSHLPGHEIKQIVDSGNFEGVLMGVNILNFLYRWDGVEAAVEAGLGVAAMNPLGGGAIPKYERELAFLAGAGETPTEAALRFVVSCPQIDVALVGFTDRPHVDLACRVADSAEPLAEADMARIRQHLAENMNSVCTACGYCEGCPQDVPVVSYMQAYNERALLGKTDEEMEKSINSHHDWGVLYGRRAEAAACSRCGQCEEACTQHLDIIDRLGEIAAWEKKIAARNKAWKPRLKRWLKRVKQAVTRRVSRS